MAFLGDWGYQAKSSFATTTGKGGQPNVCSTSLVMWPDSQKSHANIGDGDDHYDRMILELGSIYNWR